LYPPPIICCRVPLKLKIGITFGQINYLHTGQDIYKTKPHADDNFKTAQKKKPPATLKTRCPIKRFGTVSLYLVEHQKTRI
ncbi:MAG: hypothetical protein VB100_13500, partial [Angelakisella sp.]|nr:hypothetical protein [Angelakisella sp.]